MPLTQRRRKVIDSYKLGQRRCPLCGCQLVYNHHQPNTASFEHLVPKSKGGTCASRNGIVVCRRCNAERGNMCWVRWIEKINPPKKEYLLAKYLDAVAFYEQQGREITVRNVSKIKVHIENLTVNIGG